MSQYLVTGAAGFIGWRMCARLLSEGHEVVGIDNLNDAYDVRLKEWRLSDLEGKPGFQFSRVDIVDRHALGELVSGAGPFAAVVNLAARAGVRQSIRDPWCYLETNGEGTLNVLDACVAHGIPKLVLASTSSLYGNNTPRPFSEDAATDRPLSPYAASKKAAEALVHSYHHLHGLDVTVLRYFTVYGPAGRPDMSLFRFAQRIAEGRTLFVYGDGLQERDFTYGDDVARGTAAALSLRGSGVTIGRFAFVGAGAVVTAEVSDYALMLGVAARRAGYMGRHGFRLRGLTRAASTNAPPPVGATVRRVGCCAASTSTRTRGCPSSLPSSALFAAPSAGAWRSYALADLELHLISQSRRFWELFDKSVASGDRRGWTRLRDVPE